MKKQLPRSAAVGGMHARRIGRPARRRPCDRECLRSHITQIPWSLVKHDVSKLLVAGTLRVTEDAGKAAEGCGPDPQRYRAAGLPAGFHRRAHGRGGAHVMVEESGAPIMLVVRIKVVGNQLTELELVPTRSRTEGLIFNLDGLKAASAVMNYAPRADELATRDEVLKAGLKYPEGPAKAENFAAVNMPFAPDAYRYENGPDHGRPRLQVRARLPEHLHAVAGHLQRLGAR
ncbi:MAG: hypothetical protein IPG49_12775 [Proteobacteria bacterium]|nr:hypothetical protein [Pseudomonadota bacterium]